MQVAKVGRSYGTYSFTDGFCCLHSDPVEEVWQAMVRNLFGDISVDEPIPGIGRWLTADIQSVLDAFIAEHGPDHRFVDVMTDHLDSLSAR